MAAHPHEKGSPVLDNTLKYASYLFVIVCASFGIWRFTTVPATTTPAPELHPQVEDVQVHLPAELIRHTLGTGPIAFVEFSDFECPYCARHNVQVREQLFAEFIETGLARYVFVHHPRTDLHPEAVNRAVEAECAAVQGLFWEKHDELLQRTYAKYQGQPGFPVLIEGDIVPVELDQAAYDACRTAGVALTRVEADVAASSALGKLGTPTIVLGPVQPDGSVDATKKVNGALPLDVFREVLNSLVG